MRARGWLFNVLETFWIVLAGAALFLALIGALGGAWLAVASLILLGKHMVFRGNDAGRLSATFQAVSIPDHRSQRTPAVFSTRRGHRISLLTGEVEPSNSAHTSIRA
jgi:hypothetical protein